MKRSLSSFIFNLSEAANVSTISKINRLYHNHQLLCCFIFLFYLLHSRCYHYSIFLYLFALKFNYSVLDETNFVPFFTRFTKIFRLFHFQNVKKLFLISIMLHFVFEKWFQHMLFIMPHHIENKIKKQQ